MALLHEAVESKKMDVRIVERNLDRGVVSSQEVEKALKSLPDDAANADYIEIESLIEPVDGATNGLDHKH